MSKKNKARRRGPASPARAGQPKASPVRTSRAASGQDGDISPAEADAFVQEVLTSLWEGVASGDPLRAPGPFGAKSAGEVPINCMAPAVANAVYDAIGVRIRSLPITPEKVLAALDKKNAQHS